MRRITATVAALALLATPATALAKGGSFGGGGSRSSSSSSSSKSTGGSTKSAGTSSSAPKTSSAGAKSYSQSKSSIRQPSSGPIKQKAPLTRMLPATPPRPAVGSNRTFRAPAGRSYQRDQRFISNNRAYANPYYGSYYGAFDSPFFYLWAFSMMDNDNGNNAAPPQADEGEVALILASEFRLLTEAFKAEQPATKANAAKDKVAGALGSSTQVEDLKGQATEAAEAQRDKVTGAATEKLTEALTP